jgi:putative transposase
MSERLKFVQACIQRRQSIVEICLAFGISEKTGHKYLERFAREGPGGLYNRSHARHAQAGQMAPAIATRIIAARKQHRLYGPVKLREILRRQDPQTKWPAPSTIGDLLKREGLVVARRRRPSTHPHLETGRTEATAPNRVWTADFKGQFLLTRGPKCFPLTVLDLCSHFLLGCTALTTTAVPPARQRFERLFRTYGLPDVIRTDNGVPFAQPNALGRLGTLAVWWVRLGIRPEHTPLATPSANGAHERFHKTLKAHTIQPAAPSLAAQQHRFDEFRQEYNEDRPHASLGGLSPTALYTSSSREYPRRLEPLNYETPTVRRVTSAGTIGCRGGVYFLSRAFEGENVGLSETGDDLLTVAFGPLQLGDIDLRTNRFTGNVRWAALLTPRL